MLVIQILFMMVGMLILITMIMPIVMIEIFTLSPEVAPGAGTFHLAARL